MTLNDQKKKKIHVSFEGLVCFASDLYPQTDLESENGPESLLRRWLTCITNLFQVCHHAQGYSHSDYRLWDPLLRGRKFTFYLNTFTTALEVGLSKHLHFRGSRAKPVVSDDDSEEEQEEVRSPRPRAGRSPTSILLARS